MPTLLDNDLHWATQTEYVNNRPARFSALKTLLFSNARTLPTETIALDTLEGDRAMAPFVKKNGEALYVGGRTTKRHMVEAPNIRIKRSFEAAELMDTRRPGVMEIFPTAAKMNSARRQYIADEMDYMIERIEYREEWMASQVLRGSISYSDELGDSWQITFPRSASHVTDSAVDWDVGDATVDIVGDILRAAEVMAANQGASPDICLLGATAATAFRKDPTVKADLDRANYNIGALDWKIYRGMGMLPLGQLCGVSFWTYPRTLPADGGGTYSMIRDTYAEFIHLGAAMENVAYYAAIADMSASSTGIFEGQRFSKSWYTEDPSSYTSLVHTRPLFVPRKPDFCLSMNVKVT